MDRRSDGREDGAGHSKTRNRVTDAIRVWRPDRPRRAFLIAHKLAAAMALLLLAVVVVLGIEVVQIEHETEVVRRQTALAVSADGPSRLLINLQNERSWAAVEVLGQGDDVELIVEGYDETRGRTDDALAGFEELLADGPAETRRAFGPAGEGLAAELASARQVIDGSTAPRNLDNLPLSEEVFDRYNEMVEPFFVGIGEVALAIERRDLRQGAELVDLTTRQVEVLGTLGRQVSLLSILSPGGIDERGEVAEVAALRWRFTDLAEQIRAKSTGPYAGAGDDDLFVGFTEAMVGQVDGALRGEFSVEEMLATIAPPDPDDSYLGYRERVATILLDRAEQLSDAAARREQAYLGVAALTVAIATAIMVVASRSVARPLQSLAQQVMHTADQGLPEAVATVLKTPPGEDVIVPEIEAINVETRDEVSGLAGIMNAVQHAVVDLAAEQAILRRNLADSFVSLGRRNQNLLSRQLDFITQLQQGEVDPDALGHLFQLDHLATRMRRNAESLLVLAGHESPRKWHGPVSIVDVVRAALGEVENFQRVGLRFVDPFTVVGNAAADLAHLLAELIENALLFSPPTSLVEVRGLSQPAGYSLVIVDAGVGMSPTDIARANRRLAGAELLTVAPSKYLGHYVAGNLAVRHGIHVRLQNSNGPGITVVVGLPLSISPVALAGGQAGAGDGARQEVGRRP